jgi:hypothetical protein
MIVSLSVACARLEAAAMSGDPLASRERLGEWLRLAEAADPADVDAILPGYSAEMERQRRLSAARGERSLAGG